MIWKSTILQKVQRIQNYPFCCDEHSHTLSIYLSIYVPVNGRQIWSFLRFRFRFERVYFCLPLTRLAEPEGGPVPGCPHYRRYP